MTNDFETIEKKFLERRSQRIKELSASAKPHLLAYQNEGIEKITISYEGGCDDGALKEVSFWKQKQKAEVYDVQQVKEFDPVLEFGYLFLPPGWEINYGSFGIINFNLSEPNHCQITIEHSWECSVDDDDEIEVTDKNFEVMRLKLK